MKCRLVLANDVLPPTRHERSSFLPMAIVVCHTRQYHRRAHSLPGPPYTTHPLRTRLRILFAPCTHVQPLRFPTAANPPSLNKPTRTLPGAAHPTNPNPPTHPHPIPPAVAVLLHDGPQQRLAQLLVQRNDLREGGDEVGQPEAVSRQWLYTLSHAMVKGVCND